MTPPSTTLPRWALPAGIGCLVVLCVVALAVAVGGGLGYAVTAASATPAGAGVSEAVSPAAASASPLAGTATAIQPPDTATPGVAQSEAPGAATPTTAASAASDTPLPAITPTPSLAPPAGTPIGSGGRIAFLSNRDGQLFQVYTMNADGSDPRQVTTDPVPKYDPAWAFGGSQLAWSPDGRQLLYMAPGEAGTDVWVVNADGSQAANLTAAPGDDYQPTWCSDGSIWFTSDRVQGIPQIFHTTLADVAAGRRPVNFSLTHNSPREWDVELYPGCQRVLIVSPLNGLPEIWRFWPDCLECYRVVRSGRDRGGALGAPALSPDGQWLAYTLVVEGSPSIVAGRLTDRTTDSLISAGDGTRWSPDGQWLVFESSRDGNLEVYRIPAPAAQAQGTAAEPINLTGSAGQDASPVWQPAAP